MVSGTHSYRPVHAPYTHEDYPHERQSCIEDGEPWPCEVQRLREQVDRIRALAEQAKGGGFGQLCCCFDCEEAQENGQDAPHEPTWTAWTLSPAEVLRILNAEPAPAGQPS